MLEDIGLFQYLNLLSSFLVSLLTAYLCLRIADSKIPYLDYIRWGLSGLSVGFGVLFITQLETIYCTGQVYSDTTFINLLFIITLSACIMSMHSEFRLKGNK